jgi:hypothetical protein
VLICGCGHAPSRSEPIAGKNIAVIGVEGRSVVVISQIDGKTEKTLLLQPKWLTRAELTPGEHVLTALYLPVFPANSTTFSRYTFKFSAESGRYYIIRDDAERLGFWRRFLNDLLSRPHDLARLWIVDAESNKEIGELLESENEPVRNDTSLSLSPYFIWTHSGNEKRMALSRHKDGLTVKWVGQNAGESYSVAIRVYALPELNTADEFVDYLKQARRQRYSRPYSNQIKDLNEKMEKFVGRTDFCVRYRHALLEENPHRTLLESYGYSCRIPTKNRFGVDFEYSHQSDYQEKDPGMAEQADKYFGELKL